MPGTTMCYRCPNNALINGKFEKMPTVEVNLEDFEGDDCDLCHLVLAFHVGCKSSFQTPKLPLSVVRDAVFLIERELLEGQRHSSR